MSDMYYCANGKWIVETSIDSYSDYLHLFNTTGPNGSATTTTVNGYQQGHTIEETKLLADIIIEKTNTILTNTNTPCQIQNHIQTWSIQYYPGGWKGIHCHDHGSTGATAVLYFDEPSSGQDDEGAIYAILPDEYGNTKVNFWHSAPGKLLVMDARIWHGVYPTLDTRRVLVLDFEANWNE